MTKEQVIQIAEVAFPNRVKEVINLKNTEVDFRGGVYRLYDKDNPYWLSWPWDPYLSIHIGDVKFIQIQAGYRSFNHYAAIKEMERMGLV